MNIVESIRLRIPEASPSLNTLLRKHWGRDRRVKQKWHWLIYQALGLSGAYRRMRTRTPFARAHVKITRYSPRRLDEDNAIGGSKHLIDALKSCGVLVDDTPQHLVLELQQVRGAAATEIEITPIET